MEETIESFRGLYGFLSNMYSCTVEIDSLIFDNSEAAFQSRKAIGKEDIKKFVGLSGPDAKRLGKSIYIRPDWNDHRIHAMYEVTKAKYSQNENLKYKLIETFPKELVEGNTWGDKFWGKVNGEGSNFFGRILMIVRDEFIEEENNKDKITNQDIYEMDGF